MCQFTPFKMDFSDETFTSPVTKEWDRKKGRRKKKYEGVWRWREERKKALNKLNFLWRNRHHNTLTTARGYPAAAVPVERPKEWDLMKKNGLRWEMCRNLIPFQGKHWCLVLLLLERWGSHMLCNFKGEYNLFCVCMCVQDVRCTDKGKINQNIKTKGSMMMLLRWT